jgi:Aspartyl protease
MRIIGEWRKCFDGVVRPMVAIDVTTAAGATVEEAFLVDSGADATAFSADLLATLGGATAQAAAGVSIAGVGGLQAYVQVQATLNLRRTDGGTATVQASFAAFTDPKATDFSILGRDVLDHFDLILSRKRAELLLLAPPSRYEIHP